MKSPKETTKIVAKYNKFLCPAGFKAITLFGTIYTRNKCVEKNLNNGVDIRTINHEMTHVKQALGLKNSWFLFYLLYIFQWICNLPLLIVNLYAPYKFISFELESYANEYYSDYQDEIKNGAFQWKRFNKLSLREKYLLAKQFNKGTNKSFSHFAKDVIYPWTHCK